jgi:hypothetical protein
VARWDAEDYEVVEQNLEGLIADIPDMAIREIPRRYQRHTMGVSESINRMLRRVSRAVVCYHECHPSRYFLEAMGFVFLRFWSLDKNFL